MTIAARHEAQALLEIERSFAQRGYAPTVREIMAGTGIRSFRHVSEALDGLEERGIIRRLPRRSRALELLQSRGARFRFIPVSQLTWPVAA